MAIKMDGVKISVNKDEAKKPSAPKAADKAKTGKKPRPSPAKAKQGHFGLITASIIITALIVGGGIYLWKDKEYEANVGRLSESAQTTRLEFEQRIDGLKNKILGLEKNYKELETENQELKERVALLDGAKKEFSDSSLGLSFEYPALFGEVKVAILEGATGTSFMGEFTKNDTLKFGGISRNYASDSTSTAIGVLDTLGYFENRNKYYYQAAGDGKDQDHELQPAKIIGASGTEVLLLDKKSFVGQDGFSEAAGKKYIDIGENIVGLANLKSSEYGGVSFLNMDFGIMPLENFENMLRSIEVK